MTFAELKNNSKNSFAKLNDQLQKMNSNSFSDSKNEEYWYPEVDKAGNGYAVIRFLPAPEGEDMPFVRIWDHGFQGPGGWYIEKSLTTLGKPDPVSEYNGKLWNDDGSNTAKDQVRKQKRRLSYHCNIYVIKDPANPVNEGKVFRYKFGKKIFDKLNDLMNPQFPDEAPVNPFDFWAGSNFNLKIRNVEGYRNYDKSDFSSPSPLMEDDSALEGVWKQQYSLKELVAPENFKSYDELKAHLHKVLQLDAPKARREDDEPLPQATPTERKEMSFTPSFGESETKQVDSTPPWSASNDDDDDMAFFKSLADD